MTWRIHWIQHVPFEHLGHLEALLGAWNVSLTCTRAYGGEPYPGPDDFDALVVMGGPMSVNDGAHLPWIAREIECIESAIAAQRAVLGVCLGAQMITRALGAAVVDNGQREIGWFGLEPYPAARKDPLTRAICRPDRVLHWHGEVAELPDGAIALARSQACGLQAYRWQRHVLALQFHLEMTREGAQELISACRHEMTPSADFVQSEIEILGPHDYFARAEAALGELLELFLGPLSPTGPS
jgi:GMP synthase-like glutamine amidotransferase